MSPGQVGVKINLNNVWNHHLISDSVNMWQFAFSPGDSSRDLSIPKRWRSPITFGRVTFSPSQKGHKELPGLDDLLVKSYNTWSFLKKTNRRKTTSFLLEIRSKFAQNIIPGMMKQPPQKKRFTMYLHPGAQCNLKIEKDFLIQPMEHVITLQVLLSTILLKCFFLKKTALFSTWWLNQPMWTMWVIQSDQRTQSARPPSASDALAKALPLLLSTKPAPLRDTSDLNQVIISHCHELVVNVSWYFQHPPKVSLLHHNRYPVEERGCVEVRCPLSPATESLANPWQWHSGVLPSGPLLLPIV